MDFVPFAIANANPTGAIWPVILIRRVSQRNRHAGNNGERQLDTRVNLRESTRRGHFVIVLLLLPAFHFPLCVPSILNASTFHT